MVSAILAERHEIGAVVRHFGRPQRRQAKLVSLPVAYLVVLAIQAVQVLLAVLLISAVLVNRLVATPTSVRALFLLMVPHPVAVLAVEVAAVVAVAVAVRVATATATATATALLLIFVAMGP